MQWFAVWNYFINCTFISSLLWLNLHLIQLITTCRQTPPLLMPIKNLFLSGNRVRGCSKHCLLLPLPGFRIKSSWAIYSVMAAAIIFKGIIEYFHAVADSKLFCLPAISLQLVFTTQWLGGNCWIVVVQSVAMFWHSYKQPQQVSLVHLFIFAFFTHLHELYASAVSIPLERLA